MSGGGLLLCAELAEQIVLLGNPPEQVRGEVEPEGDEEGAAHSQRGNVVKSGGQGVPFRA